MVEQQKKKRKLSKIKSSTAINQSDDQEVEEPQNDVQIPESNNVAPSNKKKKPAKRAPVPKDRFQYCLREDYLIQREKDGELIFMYVKNDDTEENLLWLVYLKTIFSRQLPNMPKEYISKLVFDRNHRSVAVLSPKRKVLLGGITYRIFQDVPIGEIAFCAITDSEQVRGLGTRVMNHTKACAKEYDKLTHFLTFADNNALGFFAKNAFSDQISLSRDKWQGYIKEYDGGTLMECALSDRVPYRHFPEFIRQQKIKLNDKIKKISISLLEYDGILEFKHGKRLKIGDIPGVIEAGWTPEQQKQAVNYKLNIDNNIVEVNPHNLQKFMKQTMSMLKNNENSWPFQQPVDNLEVQDYYDVVHNPIDLSLMQKRLDSKTYYITLDIFIADFNRIIYNCKLYNNSDTIYYKAATSLEFQFGNFMADRVVFNL